VGTGEWRGNWFGVLIMRISSMIVLIFGNPNVRNICQVLEEYLRPNFPQSVFKV
jgi:hypothetical protein